MRRPVTKGGRPYNTGPVPPRLTPPAAAQSIDWKKVLFGAATAPFSPWVAARELAGSGLFGGGGRGGKGGGIWGVGGFEAFQKAFLLIKVSALALTAAFERLMSAINKGASLYTDAAKLGTTTGMVSRLQRTFAAIGLPESAVAQLMASGQFSRGMKMSPSQFSGALLGTGRGVLGKEEYQAIYNLQKEILVEWVRVGAAARQAAKSAFPLFQTRGLIEELKTEWSTFWQQLAAIASPYLDDLIDTTANFLRLLNLWLEVERELKLDAFLPKGRDKDFTKVGGVAMSRPESGWEKMGLVISGGIGGATDYARRTAAATETIAKVVTKPAGQNLSKYANLGALQFNTP